MRLERTAKRIRDKVLGYGSCDGIVLRINNCSRKRQGHTTGKYNPVFSLRHREVPSCGTIGDQSSSTDEIPAV